MKFRLSCLAVIVALSIHPGSLAFAQPVDVSIGFTSTDWKRVNFKNGKLDTTRPGWYAELAQRVGNECGHTVSFVRMPWKRVLKSVSRGQVWAAINSSYTLERAKYGQYPMKDGKPDETRAFSSYSYIALVQNGTNKEILSQGMVAGKTYIVERKASIIGPLRKVGAKIVEVADYDRMLMMVLGGRADAVALIDKTYDAVISRHPEWKSVLSSAKEPLVKKSGYIMFSKTIYGEHSELIECFWNKSAELKQSDWFRDMRLTY